MWTSYFPNPGTLIFIQQTPAEPHLDGFVAALVDTGYTPGTIQRYVRSAAHLSYWQRGRTRSLADLETADIEKFKEHLRACECERFSRVNDYDLRGARAFLRYLQERGSSLRWSKPQVDRRCHRCSCSFVSGCAGTTGCGTRLSTLIDGSLLIFYKHSAVIPKILRSPACAPSFSIGRADTEGRKPEW